MTAAAGRHVRLQPGADAALPALEEFAKSGATVEKCAADSVAVAAVVAGPIVVAAAIACAAVDERAAERVAFAVVAAGTS